jgi:putative transcriptional regulator
MKNRIFESTQNSPKPQRGQLLVATERLAGTVFDQAVVLLVQDDDNGTFGVILNRPADDKQKRDWRAMSGSPDHVSGQLVNGGPMGGPVFAIHKFQSLAEMEMPGEIFISAKAEMIQQLYNRNPENYRIYLGIAGWKEDQLVDEVDRGLWYVMDSDPEDIFDDSEWLWEKAIFRFGELALCDILGISEFDLPLDPSLN